MIILSIETSCDETAIAIVEANGDIKKPNFKLLSHSLISQIDIHAKYGGVFPSEAKRAHAENLVPIFAEALQKAKKEVRISRPISTEKKAQLKKLLEREPVLFEKLISYAETIEKPEVDMISVTKGPGLPPALWVGVNFAKALNLIWDIPVVGANHMEGHILSVLVTKDGDEKNIEFPALSLLISGGHTELVIMSDIENTEKIGQTKDDAVGEAFDKVARMMGLSYPGGISLHVLAREHRKDFPIVEKPDFPLPRPMIHTPDFDFSFSGIKTAVLYTLKKIDSPTEKQKQSIAREFEDAVTEVLVKKTKKALDKYNPKSLIIGGGVIANPYIREEFSKMTKDRDDVTLYIPDRNLATDNAVMIAVAGYRQMLTRGFDNPQTLVAESNLSL